MVPVADGHYSTEIQAILKRFEETAPSASQEEKGSFIQGMQVKAHHILQQISGLFLSGKKEEEIQGSVTLLIGEFESSAQEFSQGRDLYLQGRCDVKRSMAAVDAGLEALSLPSNPLPAATLKVDRFSHSALGKANRKDPASIQEVASAAWWATRGFRNGIYDSAKEQVSLVGALPSALNTAVRHPIRTMQEVAEVVTALGKFVYKEDWSTIRNALFPEACALGREWVSLSPEERGEGLEYVIGKYATNALGPIALVKTVKALPQIASSLKAIPGGPSYAQGAQRVAEETLTEGPFRQATMEEKKRAAYKKYGDNLIANEALIARIRPVALPAEFPANLDLFFESCETHTFRATKLGSNRLGTLEGHLLYTRTDDKALFLVQGQSASSAVRRKINTWKMIESNPHLNSEERLAGTIEEIVKFSRREGIKELYLAGSPKVPVATVANKSYSLLGVSSFPMGSNTQMYIVKIAETGK